ncbi:enoyl-CoA hydratase [Biformimicrobium ophioploci]|uniref:Enoyl-CoA hydratase n=1 Tax=Biformimicrobium ophioploci TaxID=3036711 RepID=A0ABQ6LYI5_9GAMM|nr:enoyl-CoA hydratase [Microbulbifer sp. NKW57]GMG87161.1 enoyl-CoA hydratase [Microbulbifer sp. NKW57]
MQSECPEISAQERGRVLEITINRPERKNALTQAMYAAMAKLINEAREHSHIRVVLLTGSEGNFTSGNDVADFLSLPSDFENSAVGQFLGALYHCDKPVVAAVNGPAVGIGTTLLLHSDLVYCGDDAVFQMPFVNLGLCPEFASSYFVPRLVGHVKAAELLLLCKRFDGAEAEAMGLVNACVPAAEALERARTAAEQLAAQPPAAVRLTKKLLRHATFDVGERMISEEVSHFTPLLQSGEFREAATAFMEKRKPDFSSFD